MMINAFDLLSRALLVQKLEKYQIKRTHKQNNVKQANHELYEG
jgi:hypothetical protein